MSFGIFCSNCGAPSNVTVGVCPYCKTPIENPNKKDKDGHLLSNLQEKYKKGNYQFVLRNAELLLKNKSKLKESKNFLTLYINALLETDGPPSKVKSLLSHFLLLNSEDPFAQVVLETLEAKSMMSSQKNDAGERRLKKALKSFHQFPYGHFLLGSHIYLVDNDKQTAMIHLESAVKIHPGFTRAWACLGSLYKELGNQTLSAKALRKAVALETNKEMKKFLKDLIN